MSKLSHAADVRKYSKWGRWSECPSICHIYCDEAICKRMRSKTCVQQTLCQDNKLTVEKQCGKCRSPSYKLSTPSSSLITAQLNEGIPPTSGFNQLRQKIFNYVFLKNYCLHDGHFSQWSSWSRCVPGCRRVRFRHCLTVQCKERVAHRDDPAITEEQWCLPDDPEAGKHCTENYKHTEKAEEQMEPGKCEEKLLRVKEKEERRERRKNKDSDKRNHGRWCHLFSRLSDAWW